MILCGALAISAGTMTGAVIPMTVQAQETDGTQRMLEAQFEDAEGFRLFRYRTLRALNKIRDAGLTPQAIVETLQGARDDGTMSGLVDQTGLGEAGAAVSDYTGELAQSITDTAREQTQTITEDAAAAAQAQMNNWADSLGRSIGNAIRRAIADVLGDGSEE